MANYQRERPTETALFCQSITKYCKYQNIDFHVKLINKVDLKKGTQYVFLNVIPNNNTDYQLQ